MRIAVNYRFLKTPSSRGKSDFTGKIFIRLAKICPEHTFIFLCNKPLESELAFPENVQIVMLALKANNAWAHRWWFDVKIPMALKKYKADVLICPDGHCSLFTSVPQVLIVHDLSFLQFPAFVAKRNLLFHKYYTPRFLKRAKTVATVSQFLKEQIIQRYKIADAKIINVQSAVQPNFQPIEWEEKEAVKEKYTEGCEYFVFTGGIHPRSNLINLLKAFSIFKRWQKTNMKLVIADQNEPAQKSELVEKLKTYKYRDDIELLDQLPDDELAKVVAASYGMVYPVLYQGFAAAVLQGMQSGVPVITSQGSSMPEIGSDACMYIDPQKPAEIAEQMKKLFKDEALRTEMIRKGKEEAKRFSWEKTAGLLWQTIQNSISG